MRDLRSRSQRLCPCPKARSGPIGRCDHPFEMETNRTGPGLTARLRVRVRLVMSSRTLRTCISTSAGLESRRRTRRPTGTPTPRRRTRRPTAPPHTATPDDQPGTPTHRRRTRRPTGTPTHRRRTRRPTGTPTHRRRTRRPTGTPTHRRRTRDQPAPPHPTPYPTTNRHPHTPTPYPTTNRHPHTPTPYPTTNRHPQHEHLRFPEWCFKSDFTAHIGTCIRGRCQRTQTLNSTEAWLGNFGARGSRNCGRVVYS